MTRFLILKKNMGLIVEAHVREDDSTTVTRGYVRLERGWQAIESGVFYPALSNFSCSSCDDRTACRSRAGEGLRRDGTGSKHR